jgi:mannose-6-phosphate isomerase-like protein (cupin superfamily)
MKIFSSKTLTENKDTCCIETQVKELSAQETGDQNLNIKIFKMHPEGHSSLHQHPAQHRLFITDGGGVVFDGEKNTPIQSGDVVYIMANEIHQFKNIGKKPLKFICITLNTK